MERERGCEGKKSADGEEDSERENGFTNVSSVFHNVLSSIRSHHLARTLDLHFCSDVHPLRAI